MDLDTLKSMLVNYTSTKEKLIELSQKMNHICTNVENAVGRNDSYIEEMKSSFKVNDKILYENEITSTRKSMDGISNNIRYTVIPDIQNQINDINNQINDTQNQINYLESEIKRKAEEEWRKQQELLQIK